jgi:F420-dependent oxidoreductase-like protein
MRFGIFVPQGWRMDLFEIEDPVEKYEAMTRVAREADDTEFDSIWVYDHLHTVPNPELETTFECWTITSTLARDTKRVKIGQMVGCNGYRNPALYAKIASTVEVASHGRLYAGIGAGWYEQEWKAYGYPWWDTKERMGHFREAVEIIYKMWTEDRPVYSGRYYSIDGPINEPKGVQKPHPSFWIGGAGEQVTLKLVAKYGNACNVNADLESTKRKLDILDQHCLAIGRDPKDVIKSSSLWVHLVEPGDDPVKATAATRKVSGDITLEQYKERYIVGSYQDVRDRIEQLAAIGIEYVIVYLARVGYEPELVKAFASEIIPTFAAI